MDSIITTSLGKLLVKPVIINEKGKSNSDNYFDKLYVYHDRYIESSDTVTKDVIGFASNNKYMLQPNDIYGIRNIDIDSKDITISGENMSMKDYVILSGFMDYITNCKFNTKTVKINLSPECEENLGNIKIELEAILESLNDHITKLGLGNIVELEYIEDIRTMYTTKR